MACTRQGAYRGGNALCPNLTSNLYGPEMHKNALEIYDIKIKGCRNRTHRGVGVRERGNMWKQGRCVPNKTGKLFYVPQAYIKHLQNSCGFSYFPWFEGKNRFSGKTDFLFFPDSQGQYEKPIKSNIIYINLLNVYWYQKQTLVFFDSVSLC